METKRRKFGSVRGFTIVELLTVMAIIAILMGLLVPAMNQVRKLAKDTSQKAQFHSIDVALEAYSAENGMYPESMVSTSASPYTIGAHKLAEALVGRDLLGYDTKSTWDAAADDTNSQIYADKITPVVSADDKVAASLKRRQGPYLNPENVEAFQVNQLFESYGNVYPGGIQYDSTRSPTYVSAPVLTDVYHAKKVTMPNGKTMMAGTPILYYKANTSSTSFPDVTDSANFTSITVADANAADYIYNIFDNDELVKLYQMMKPTNANPHRFDENRPNETIDGSPKNGVWIFYNTITNPKITNQPRPFNMSSYILMSAGADGIYGTRDDIYNFQQ